MSSQQYPDKRTEMLNGWREGIRANQYQQESVKAVDQRRAEMLDERNQAAMVERQKMMQGNLMGSLMEERMRQKDMLELHNEAIRKIQATANRNAK
jgi:tRNA A37 methylthiotransferase MiaB